MLCSRFIVSGYETIVGCHCFGPQRVAVDRVHHSLCASPSAAEHRSNQREGKSIELWCRRYLCIGCTGAPDPEPTTRGVPFHARVSAAQGIGGKNDQRSRDCCRVAPRWHFAGSGTKRPCDWQRTASSRRRCGQPHSRCAVCCTVSSLRDEAPQKHLPVGKEPQRLKDEYHQVAISKSRFNGPGSLVSGALFEFSTKHGGNRASR